MSLRFYTLLHLSLAGIGICQYNNNEITIDPAKHDEQFFSFKSRPDIEAPRWESKVYNEAALAPGYWFVSPYGIVAQTSNDHQYVAPVIYDSISGELVWNGGREVDYFNIFSLKVTQFQDQPMLSYLQPAESQGVIMNNHYAPVRHVRVGTIGVTSNMHDFQIVDDGTKALYMTSSDKPVSRDRSLAFEGYDGQCRVIFAGIEERDLETDEVTFSWNSEGHVTFDESYAYPVPEGFNSQYNITTICGSPAGVDYIHGNSVEKLPDGDYLMSSRHMYAIYKISHIDGSIVWRLGGKKSDFTMGEGVHFSAQHDARCLFQNSTHMTISLMDNAVGVWEAVGYTSNPNSRGLVISLNTETMVATEVAHYDHPDGVGAYAFERGNVQTLPNGNVFITWTISAQHSEYTADGTLIAEAKLLTPLKTYRSYKFPWVGHRRQRPDIHSEVITEPELRTVVRVSWNGDTQAAQWRLYETDAHGEAAELLNRTRKTGFETTLTYKGYLPYVKVNALDKAGKVLDASESNAVQTIYTPKPGAATIDLQAPVGSEDSTTAVGPDGTDDATWETTARSVPTDHVLYFLGGMFLSVIVFLVIRRTRLPSVRIEWSRPTFAYSPLKDDEESSTMGKGL